MMAALPIGVKFVLSLLVGTAMLALGILVLWTIGMTFAGLFEILRRR